MPPAENNPDNSRPHYHKPDCGDPSHDHGKMGNGRKGMFTRFVPPAATPAPTPPPIPERPFSAHSHPHASSGGVGDAHPPKGKSHAGWWVAAAVTAVTVGAYLINEYGKRPDRKGKALGERENSRQR